RRRPPLTSASAVSNPLSPTPKVPMRVARNVRGPHPVRELVAVAGPLQACVNDTLRTAGHPTHLHGRGHAPAVAVQYEEPFWVVVSNVPEVTDELERIAVEALDRDGPRILDEVRRRPPHTPE